MSALSPEEGYETKMKPLSKQWSHRRLIITIPHMWSHLSYLLNWLELSIAALPHASARLRHSFLLFKVGFLSFPEDQKVPEEYRPGVDDAKSKRILYKGCGENIVNTLLGKAFCFCAVSAFRRLRRRNARFFIRDPRRSRSRSGNTQYCSVASSRGRKRSGARLPTSCSSCAYCCSSLTNQTGRFANSPYAFCSPTGAW